MPDVLKPLPPSVEAGEIPTCADLGQPGTSAVKYHQVVIFTFMSIFLLQNQQPIQDQYFRSKVANLQLRKEYRTTSGTRTTLRRTLTLATA